MGVFAKKLNCIGPNFEKQNLFECYLRAVQNAIKESNFDELEKVNFYFYNFSGEDYVENTYKDYFSSEKIKLLTEEKQKNFSFYFGGSRESFFNSDNLNPEKREEEESFYVLLMAGDDKAYLNNGAHLDNSMESCLAGFKNTNFSGAPWLLNIFWPSLLQKLEETLAERKLEQSLRTICLKKEKEVVLKILNEKEIDLNESKITLEKIEKIVDEYNNECNEKKNKRKKKNNKN